MNNRRESNDLIITRIRQDPWLFFIVTYIWTWGFWIPVVLLGENILTFPYFLLFGLGGMGPSISAIFLTYLKEDRDVWHNYWKRVVDIKRIGIVWLAVALFFPAFTSGLAMITGILINGIFPSFETALEYFSDPITFLLYLLFTLIYGPLPEELGWRGYALDRLQKKWNAFNSSIILGILWVLWHWPMFFMVGTYQSEEIIIGSVRFWLAFCAGIIATTILMTWIYNNTKRSTLSAVLSHFMINLTGEFLNLFDLLEYYKAIWTIILAGLVITVYGPKSLTRTPKEKHMKKEITEIH